MLGKSRKRRPEASSETPGEDAAEPSRELGSCPTPGGPLLCACCSRSPCPSGEALTVVSLLQRRPSGAGSPSQGPPDVLPVYFHLQLTWLFSTLCPGRSVNVPCVSSPGVAENSHLSPFAPCRGPPVWELGHTPMQTLPPTAVSTGEPPGQTPPAPAPFLRGLHPLPSSTLVSPLPLVISSPAVFTP